MAEGDDPVLEIRVTGDWSEFDRQAVDRENRAQSTGLTIRSAGTFGAESSQIGGGGGSAGLLGGPDVSRAQAAMGRLASALERQASQMEKGILPFPTYSHPAQLPQLREGFARAVHLTSAGPDQFAGGFNYAPYGMLSSSARAWGDQNQVDFSSPDPRFANARRAIVMDIPFRDLRSHENVAMGPGMVPASQIVGSVELGYRENLPAVRPVSGMDLAVGAFAGARIGAAAAHSDSHGLVRRSASSPGDWSPGPGHRALPAPALIGEEMSGGGGGGPPRRALPPAADFEGSWSPHPDTINIPNAAGGGGGGRALPPPGGGGGGGGGGYGWRGGWAGPGMTGAYGNVMPWGAHNVINPNAGRFWNRLRNFNINTGLYYTALFGGYEVGRAARASQEAILNAAIAPTSLEALQAQQQGIEQITGGILGSTLSLGSDILGAFTPAESPAKLRETYALETLRNRLYESSRGESNTRMITRAVQAGQLSDLYSAAGTAAFEAQRFGQRDLAIVRGRQEQGRINEQLSATHTTLDPRSSLAAFSTGGLSLLWDNPVTTVNDISDAGTRTSLTARRRLIDTEIKTQGDNASFDTSFNKFQTIRAVENQVRGQQVEALQLSLGIGRNQDTIARVPIEDINLRDAHRRRTATAAVYAEQIRQAQFTPELIPGLESKRNAELGVLDSEIADLNDQKSSNRKAEWFVDRGSTVSRQLRGARRFVAAAIEEERYAAEAEIEAQRLDPRQAARRRAQAGNRILSIQQQEDFDNQQALIATRGSNTALGYLLQNNPLAAQMSQLKTSRELEIGRIDPDRKDLKAEKNKEFDQKEALLIKGEAEKRFEINDSLNAGIRQSRLRQRGGDLDILEAGLDSVATGTLTDIRGMERQGLGEDTIAKRRQLGVEQVRETRAGYYRSMRFSEVGGGRIAATESGQDSAEARFGAAERRISEGKADASGDTSPVTSKQAEEAIVILRGILAKRTGMK